MVLSKGWTKGRRKINENPDKWHHEVGSSWKNDYMVLWLRGQGFKSACQWASLGYAKLKKTLSCYWLCSQGFKSAYKSRIIPKFFIKKIVLHNFVLQAWQYELRNSIQGLCAPTNFVGGCFTTSLRATRVHLRSFFGDEGSLSPWTYKPCVKTLRIFFFP
jgi:hypothetical protein